MKQYKALCAIGGYVKGDIIPYHKAIVWMDMYAKPCIEVIENNEEKVENPSPVLKQVPNFEPIPKPIPKPEPEPVRTSLTLTEVKKIKGIGRKTAKDILEVYPFKEQLIEDIANNKKLPFRDDVCDKLIKEYGE